MTAYKAKKTPCGYKTSPLRKTHDKCHHAKNANKYATIMATSSLLYKQLVVLSWQWFSVSQDSGNVNVFYTTW